MKKILFILILAISLYLAANYLLNTLLPEKINKAAKEFIAENFGRKITISQIDINLLRGIFLKNITIFEPDGKTPYLKIITCRTVPFYPSLLTEKKLFLSLNLEGVYFTLERNTDNTFNFPQMQPAGQTASASVSANQTVVPVEKSRQEIFLVKNLSLKGLNLNFVDKTAGFQKKFEDINAFIDLQAYPKVTAEILWQTQATAETQTREKATINAKYDLSSRELKTSILLKEIALSDFNCYFPVVVLKGGSIKEATLNLEGKEDYTLKINAGLNDLSLTKENAQIKGNAQITGQVEIKTNASAEKITYNIAGKLSEGTLKFPPYLDNLTQVYANLALDNKRIQITGLNAVFSGASEENKVRQAGIALTANSEVNLETAQITIEAKTRAKITELIKALKTVKLDNLDTLKRFEYEEGGDIILSAKIKTDLSASSLDYYLDYNIKGAKYKELENIQAKGFLANDRLKIEACSFIHKNIPWQAALELNSFSSPDVQLSASSDLLELNLSAKQLKDLTAIKNLTIKTKNSQVKLEGGFHKESQELELQGLGYIELSEITPLAEIYAIKASGLKKADPQGILNAKFMVKGPLTPNRWQIKLAGLSEKLKIYNLETSEVKLELYKDKDLLIISPLVANVAQGKIELRTKIDFSGKKIIVNTLINEIDLANLRRQLKLKNSSLSGILSLEADFQNFSLTSLDKLDGSGKVNIHDGNIWEINFLKGLGEFLFIPEFEQIKFEEGYSDLIFKGENVVFENIELKSFQMNLRGKGRICLRGDLNFLLVSEFNPNLVSASEGLRKFFTSVLGQSSLAIELQGTVKKPAYNVKPVFFSDLKGFKKILEGIFQ